MSDSPPPAVNPLPPAVIVLFLTVVLCEAYIAGAEAQLWGQFDARLGLIRQFAFLPEGFERALSAGIWQPELFGACSLTPSFMPPSCSRFWPRF